MTLKEILDKKPCCKCIHFTRCKVVDYVYSPCYEGGNSGEYHPAFELNTNTNEETENE